MDGIKYKAKNSLKWLFRAFPTALAKLYLGSSKSSATATLINWGYFGKCPSIPCCDCWTAHKISPSSPFCSFEARLEYAVHSLGQGSSCHWTGPSSRWLIAEVPGPPQGTSWREKESNLKLQNLLLSCLWAAWEETVGIQDTWEITRKSHLQKDAGTLVEIKFWSGACLRAHAKSTWCRQQPLWIGTNAAAPKCTSAGIYGSAGCTHLGSNG